MTNEIGARITDMSQIQKFPHHKGRRQGAAHAGSIHLLRCLVNFKIGDFHRLFQGFGRMCYQVTYLNDLHQVFYCQAAGQAPIGITTHPIRHRMQAAGHGGCKRTRQQYRILVILAYRALNTKPGAIQFGECILFGQIITCETNNTGR